MERIVHNLSQGSDDWHQFRLEHFGASEASTMLGISRNMKRNELLRAKKTGIAKEFSDWVQRNILDYGHEVEQSALLIAEKYIGKELYPATYSMGDMSASCDGITEDDTAAFEHKQWNTEYGATVAAGAVPEEHMPQCQQVLYVTGAERLLFVVSDGTEDNFASVWVYPDAEYQARIVAGWKQFDADLAAYVPTDIKEMPKADVVVDLPSLFVHAKGEITTHNMDEFGKALALRLAETRAIILITDQDFSNAKAGAKKFRETAKAIALSKEAMLAQTETIGEAARKMDAWAKDLNATALQLEKDVEREDKAKKEVMVLAAKGKYTDHVAALEAEIKPIRLSLVAPNFAEAIKGKSKYTNMQDAVDTMLACAVIAADQSAKDVREKLEWCKDNAKGYSALFPDLQQIIVKPMDDFTLTITSRIDKAKANEARREEETRARIDAERAKIAEEQEKAVDIMAEQQMHTAAPVVASVAVEHDAPVTAAPYSAPAEDNGAMMTLGQISTRLGFVLTKDFLASLGFLGCRNGAAMRYPQRDLPAICAAIVRHIQDVEANI